MIQRDELQFLIDQGKQWIAAERAARYPHAHPLSDQLRRQLASYFPANILDIVRIQFALEVPNPPFYAQLVSAGRPMPLDFSQMAGITFIDTVLIAQPKVTPNRLTPLIFHECVHVVQYALLGLDQFIDCYVTGWAKNGRQYDRIPFEAEAYQLEAAFTQSRGTAFSVETMVRKSLGL